MNLTTKKPIVKLVGKNGNVFNLISICYKALRRAKQPDKAKEMSERIFTCGSYSEALQIMMEYCEVE